MVVVAMAGVAAVLAAVLVAVLVAAEVLVEAAAAVDRGCRSYRC